jgi:hypothetical protein
MKVYLVLIISARGPRREASAPSARCLGYFSRKGAEAQRRRGRRVVTELRVFQHSFLFLFFKEENQEGSAWSTYNNLFLFPLRLCASA